MKMAVLWVVMPCSLLEVYRRSEVPAALLTLMIEAASISETSVNFYRTTEHNNPEDSHIHTRCRKNLKSYQQS
jgi:hypothetical protein